ncbi:MAG: YfhO family protein [Thermoplasmatota archaeon]
MKGEPGRVPLSRKLMNPGWYFNGGRREDLVYIILILITICLFFWKVLLHPDWMIFSDHSDTVEQFYPWRFAAGDAANDGVFPFWNPYNYGGEPLLANMQLGYFYPINLLLFALLPAHSAFGFSFMLHLFIAGTSVYLVGKRVGLGGNASFLSGIIFIFSGYFIGHIYSGHYGQVCSASWIPMIYLSFDHAVKRSSLKWGALTGLLVGMQFLAGHIQIVLFSVIMLLISYLYHLYWHRAYMKKAKKWLGTIPAPILGGVVSLIIAAIQIIPTYIYTQQSTRSGGMSYLWATDYSLPPYYLVTSLVPRFFGTPLESNYLHFWNYWELSIYMGIPTLVLIACSWKFRKNRYVRFFFGLGIFSIVMAMGRFTPVYWVFYKLVPGFDILRVPARFFLLALFSGSILAGFGLRSLGERLEIQERKRLMSVARSMIRAVPAVLVLVIIFMAVRSPLSALTEDLITKVVPDEGNATDKVSIIGSTFDTATVDVLVFLLLLMGTAGILIWRARESEAKRRLGLVLTSFIILNLAFYHMPFIDSRDPDDIYRVEPYIAFLQKNSGGYRVYDPEDLMIDNFQIIHGLETVKGYNPIELRYYSELIGTIRNLSHNREHPVLDMLGVRYIVSPEIIMESGFRLVHAQYEGKRVFVYENPGALHRAFLVGDHTVMTDEEAIGTLRGIGFDPMASVLVNTLPKARGDEEAPSSENSTLKISVIKHNRVDIEVSLSKTSFLVLGQSYYPSWDVIVDGNRYDTERVYHALMGVCLNEGNHEVSFVYDRYP